MKKVLRSITYWPLVPVILTILCAAKCRSEGFLGDQKAASSNRLLYEGAERSFSDTTLKSLIFIESEFDNGTFRGVTFEDCEFLYRGYVSDLTVDSIRFVDCKIREVAFSFGVFSQVAFIGCEIDQIEFKDISIVREIEFRRCSINAIRFLRSNVVNVAFPMTECTKLTVEDCIADGIRYSGAGPSQIVLRRGNASGFDIRDIRDRRTSVTLEYTELSRPGISPELASSINFRKALIPDDFTLMQDHQSDLGFFGRKITRESYLDAITVYSAIREQFKELGVGRVERRMEYLMKAAERKALPSSTLRAVTYVWDEQVRGYYGTNPGIVIRSAFWLWLLFSFLYFILGKLRVAWGSSIEVSALGEPIEGVVPQIIVNRAGFPMWRYFLACLSFSVDQLLIVGIRQGFGVSHFTEHVMKVPRRHIGIGVGRIVAGVENIVGLILLFSFVQAFLRSL